MELARIETGEDHPGISVIRKWKRVASTRCIYGVDLNSLAVELCKVAIWMDTYDGSNPLSFLDAHIRQGNSLLGERMEKMGLSLMMQCQRLGQSRKRHIENTTRTVNERV